jgi:hypothetical protein
VTPVATAGVLPTGCTSSSRRLSATICSPNVAMRPELNDTLERAWQVLLYLPQWELAMLPAALLEAR